MDQSQTITDLVMKIEHQIEHLKQQLDVANIENRQLRMRKEMLESYLVSAEKWNKILFLSLKWVVVRRKWFEYIIKLWL